MRRFVLYVKHNNIGRGMLYFPNGRGRRHAATRIATFIASSSIILVLFCPHLGVLEAVEISEVAGKFVLLE